MTPDLRILSLGGGTQSCALALMSARGDLPRLDHVIFADTQGERPETYAYLLWLRYQLGAAGIQPHVVTAGSLEQALLSTTPTNHNPTPPSHVINRDGSKGRVGGYRCSYDFKRRQVERKVKRLCGGRGAWKRTTVEQWIGFSADEVGRCRQSDDCRCGHKAGKHREDMSCANCKCGRFDRWQTNVWPLAFELRMKREDTIAWFTDHGYPVPPRSACWFCPNSGNERWSALKDDHPPLWERAVHLDHTIRGEGGFRAQGGVRFDGAMYLHGDCVPLDQADLRSKEERLRDAGHHTLWDEDVIAMDCESGSCFT